MLAFVDSPWLRMNMDTGNTFIAGQDPVAFLQQFLPKVSHVHLKDVSPSLAAAVRGDQTGIAVSHCSLGEGVNAEKHHPMSGHSAGCWLPRNLKH